jgi:hypothetical protein
MDLFKTNKSPARVWLLVLGALTLVGVAVLLSSCNMEEEAPPPDDVQTSRPRPIVTPEDVDEALKGAIPLTIDKDYEKEEDGTWEHLLEMIEAACKDVPGKTVALDISATRLAVNSNKEFDPRDSSGNPYDTGEPYITKLTLPNAAEAIAGGNADNGTFAGFTGLVEVSADKVETINKYAFSNTPKLQTAYFRAVTSIGMQAFEYCPALAHLYLPETPPLLPTGGGLTTSSLFQNDSVTDGTLTIHVPVTGKYSAWGSDENRIYGAGHKQVVITAE